MVLLAGSAQVRAVALVITNVEQISVQTVDTVRPLRHCLGQGEAPRQGLARPPHVGGGHALPVSVTNGLARSPCSQHW